MRDSNAALPATPTDIDIIQLGRRPYLSTWQAMRDFTEQRDADSEDQLWLVEHPPVYTQGQAGRAEHILDPGAIEVVNSDRGGQVTYHGPGQQIVYVLIDLQRRGIGVKALVTLLEQATIELLASYAISGATRNGAPGVYCNDAKIAALGLRVRRGRSYHGLSLNVDMDLEPFSRINPCGYAGLGVTQLSDHGGPSELSRIGPALAAIIARRIQAASRRD